MSSSSQLVNQKKSVESSNKMEQNMLSVSSQIALSQMMQLYLSRRPSIIIYSQVTIFVQLSISQKEPLVSRFASQRLNFSSFFCRRTTKMNSLQKEDEKRSINAIRYPNSTMANGRANQNITQSNLCRQKSLNFRSERKTCQNCQKLSQLIKRGS